MFTPAFPYTGSQVIISSGRVLNHSKDDFIFLFGKKGVSVSSPATFTVDAQEKTIIDSPKIELGYQAETKGEPVLLGRSTVVQLQRLLVDLNTLCVALEKLNAERTQDAINPIIAAAGVLKSTSKEVEANLQVNCLSKNTYTK